VSVPPLRLELSQGYSGLSERNVTWTVPSSISIHSPRSYIGVPYEIGVELLTDASREPN